MRGYIGCHALSGENEDFIQFTLSENEILNIQITETEKFNSRLPDILNALIELVYL